MLTLLNMRHHMNKTPLRILRIVVSKLNTSHCLRSSSRPMELSLVPIWKSPSW
jgi:hypothetical protein